MKHPNRIAAVAMTAIALVILTSSPAFAAAPAAGGEAANAAVFEIPAVPLGLVVVLTFLSPLAIAVVNQEFWAPRYKKVVSVAAAALLAAMAIAIYYALTKEPLPDWPILVLIGVAVSQLSYTLVLKKPASRIEELTSVD
jgi:hypothetical protein